MYLKVGTHINHVQLHCLQVAIVTPKGGIGILRSLLTDNPPSPGKVGHPTDLYVPSLFSNSGTWVLLHPTRTRYSVSESAVRLDLWFFILI